MVMFSPRREPEPDLRVQFAEYAEVMGYPLQKRVENKPGPCILCGLPNCTGDGKHGNEQVQAVEQPPQWWLPGSEEDGGNAEAQ